MTVDRILMQPIAEAEEQLNPLVGMQLRDVLPSRVCGHGWSDSVACQDPVLLQVNVNGMRPVTGKVGQEPLLHAVLLHREAESLREAAGTDAAIHELPVDGPLPVQAVELERPRDSRRSEEHTSELQSRRDLVC